MSAPMIAWVPIVNRVYRYWTSSNSKALQPIKIAPVEIHDVETSPEKRQRTLKHLLKANHANFSVFFHNLQFDNHMPHILCSAYVLGASADQLQHVYDEEAKFLEPWQDSPAEITDADWRDFLGDRKYQRAYVDFFEDELALKYGYDWKKVADEYLFQGRNPLINCVVSALGHAVIHLGYAYEFSSREIGMEALSLIASAYNDYHKYIDDPSYTKPSKYSSSSPLDILGKVREDTRLDKLFKYKGGDNVSNIFMDHEDILLEYWNAWELEDPVKQFQESQETAVSLFVGSVKPGTHAYDFFLVHLLTSSHAVRILLPMVPEKFHINLIRQWWLLTLAVYIGQLRPKIEEIGNPDLGGKHWNYVDKQAITGPFRADAHYVKALRAMKEAAMTWGDVHERYLRAAVTFADDFKGWTGFSPTDVETH